MSEKLLGGYVRDYSDLKNLKESELVRLCAEIRQAIVSTTLSNGGHLASSLGAVELVVSLLRTFDPSRDKLVFDVGHQSYAYKLLTGRLESFSGLRRKGGISGFPRRHESPFDHFDTGHSSTSISAALGMAKARDIAKQRHEVVAVIGDGALLNGMAFEALNCIRSADTKVIIILNDNEMSIDPRVGGMAEHLAHISVNPTYHRLKRFVKEQCRALENGKRFENTISRWKTKLKSLLQPTNVFEAMNITYWGPFDGHDMGEMEEILRMGRSYPESLLIHVITKKGKGFAPAEQKPCSYHGVGAGTVPGSTQKTPPADWSAAVASKITSMAGTDPRIVCCTAAMKEGTRLGEFGRKYPRRFFDVGIAEEHMFTFAAGMAAGGLRPVVCVYSTFMQRAMDQIVHDVCMQRLPVLMCVDRAGLVGEDGETHQGVMDICWSRPIPNLVIAAPRDRVDLNFMMEQWLSMDTPVLIRYPKGHAPVSLYREDDTPHQWGCAQVLVPGMDVCLVGVGSTVKLMMDAHSLCAERGITLPTVVDARFIKPFDEGLFSVMAKTHRKIIVAEEGYMTGGLGEGLSAAIGSQNCQVVTLGVRDRFIPQASRDEQLAEEGFTTEQVISLMGSSEK